MAEQQVIPLTYPEGGEGPECVDVEHWLLYKNPFRYLGQICQFGAKKFKIEIKITVLPPFVNNMGSFPFFLFAIRCYCLFQEEIKIKLLRSDCPPPHWGPGFGLNQCAILV